MKRHRVKTDGRGNPSHDLPFQSKGRFTSRPHETWTLLRVKFWRLQQRLAQKLRHSVRFWRKVLSEFWEALSIYGDKAGEVLALATWTVWSHEQLRTRFRTGSHADREEVSRGDIVGDRANQLRSTWVRRGYYAARTVVVNFARGLRATTLGVVGLQCLLCGSLYHSTMDCLRDFEQMYFLEADHLESAITRMRDVSIREEDWSDDYIRIGVARLAMRHTQNARLLGLVFWFSRFARLAARAGGLGVLVQLLRYPVLANELWRVLTGSAVLPAPPRMRLLLHRIWGAEGLYDFANQELRARGLAPQYPGAETPVQGSTSEPLDIRTDPTTALVQLTPDAERDTVFTIGRGMVLSQLVDTQLEVTALVLFSGIVESYVSQRRESGFVPLLSNSDMRALVCPQCMMRAWYGSTCAKCRSMKASVRSLDADLWRVRPMYVYQDANMSLDETADRLLQLQKKFAELSDMMAMV